MSLSIKNDQTCRLASDLALLAGEIMTGAITVASRGRLERQQCKRDIVGRARKLRATAERCAALMGPGPSMIDHGDLRYDESSLPR